MLSISWVTEGATLSRPSQEREELSEIDLKKVMELKGPDPSGNQEAQSSFQLVLEERVYHLRADTPQEAESWFSFLKHTQVWWTNFPLGQSQVHQTDISQGSIQLTRNIVKSFKPVETFRLL